MNIFQFLTTRESTAIIAIFIIAIVLIIALAIVSINREKRGREASKRAVISMKNCPVCGGAMHPGNVQTVYGVFLFKSEGKVHPIGGARCEKCGYTALFS